MSNSRFDAETFYAALDTERQARGKTWKQVAAESKISASTLTRMGQGKRPDVDSLAALAAWSGLDIDQYVLGKRPVKSATESLAKITALLRADRNLGTDGAQTLEAILKSGYAHLKRVRKDET